MKSSRSLHGRRGVAFLAAASLSGALAFAGFSCASLGHTSAFDGGASDSSLVSADAPGSFGGDGGTLLSGDASSAPDTGAPFTGPLAGPFGDFPATPILDMPDGGGGAA